MHSIPGAPRVLVLPSQADFLSRDRSSQTLPIPRTSDELLFKAKLPGSPDLSPTRKVMLNTNRATSTRMIITRTCGLIAPSEIAAESFLSPAAELQVTGKTANGS